ncbi:MAG TPA: pyrimidine reductase family protein [Acidimicrobiales bacterium]|nr:pyrimidine reductase family protein [Acidimicrobiales bacterium]
MITQILPERRPIAGAAELEEFYLHHDPCLRVNFVASLDGVVEIDGRSGPLGGEADRSAFMAMRAGADAVLVGAGTVRAEDYGPVRLGDEVQARRARRGQAATPRLAIVTGRGDLDPAARVFSQPGTVMIFTTEEVAAGRPDLAGVAELIACGRAEVDLASVVAGLRRRGLGRILCEGGPGLARTLLEAGLIDELCLTIAPTLAGAGQRLIGADRPARPGRFRLTGLLESDSLLLARYRVGSDR